MSLPAGQQRILDGIEDGLRAHDSRLASLFATFSRLTRQEEMPQTEQLVPGRRRTRRRRQWRTGRPAEWQRRGVGAWGPGARPYRGGPRWLTLAPIAFIAVLSALIIALLILPSQGGGCPRGKAPTVSSAQGHASGCQGPRGLFGTG